MTPAFRAWWPALAWGVAILVLTTAPASAPEGVAGTPYVDKLVHFLLYLGLGFSLGRALRLSGRATTGGVLAAAAAGSAFGAANEWIQGFVPIREPSAGDWLADVAGVSLGIALDLWRRHRDSWPEPGHGWREPGEPSREPDEPSRGPGA